MANPLICVFNPVTSFIDEVQSVSSGPAANGIPIVTNLLGVIDTSLLGIGSIATAGQTIGAGQLVNLYSFAGTLHAQVASAQNGGGSPPAGPYPLQAQGFAAGNAVSGGPFTVSFFGTFKYVDGNSEFTTGSIGAEVYLSDRGDGSPTLTPPSGGGELEQSVGYVVAFVSPNVVTINFASGFQDFTHISGVNPITKGGTGATTSAQALLNLINNPATTGQALIYNGTNWVPGTDLTTFTDITSGTNSVAAMVVGTGATLNFSGSGTINANQLTGDPVNTVGRTTGQALVWSGSAWTPSSGAITAFNDLTSGTNTTAAMVVGTGASLSFSGTGTVNANQLFGVTISGVAPTTGQVLTATSGSTANWQSSGSGSPGGANTDVQYNNSGAFGGDANFTWDPTTGSLSAGKSGIGGSGASTILFDTDTTSGKTNQIALGNSFVNIGANIPGSNTIIIADQNIQLEPTNGVVQVGNSIEINFTTAGIGYFGTPPVAQATITGSRDGNAALGSLLSALSANGFLVNSTTAGSTPIFAVDTHVTTTYATLTTDYYVRGDSTTPFTITLTESGITAGKAYKVKNLNTGQITVVGQSGNIDNQPNYLLNQYDAAEFEWDGTNWWVF